MIILKSLPPEAWIVVIGLLLVGIINWGKRKTTKSKVTDVFTAVDSLRNPYYYDGGEVDLTGVNSPNWDIDMALYAEEHKKDLETMGVKVKGHVYGRKNR